MLPVPVSRAHRASCYPVGMTEALAPEKLAGGCPSKLTGGLRGRTRLKRSAWARETWCASSVWASCYGTTVGPPATSPYPRSNPRGIAGIGPGHPADRLLDLISTSP